MTNLSGFGLSIEVPAQWEGQIRGQVSRQVSQGAQASAVAASPSSARADEAALALLHVASFALPAQRGDYGSGAVEKMRAGDILLCLLEHDRSDASQPLFARSGLPTLTPDRFSPTQMQRTIAGMAGTQEFFTLGDRAFCLYVVVGSWRTRTPLVRSANAVVQSLQVDAG